MPSADPFSTAEGRRDDVRTTAIADTVHAANVNGQTILSRGGNALRITGSETVQRQIVSLLRTGCDENDLGRRIGYAKAAKLITKLNDLGWAYDPGHRTAPAPPVPARLSAGTPYLSLFNPDKHEALTRLRQARIVIVGLGGIGAVVLEHLVRAGARNFLLCDPDTIDESNLNRQLLYRPADVGRAKAEIAARVVREFEPRATVRTDRSYIATSLDVDNLIGDWQASMIVAAGDPQEQLLSAIETYSKIRGIAYCGAAVGIGVGQWGPLIGPGTEHNLRCIRSSRKNGMSPLSLILEKQAPEPARMSFGPSNTIVSAFLAHDIVSYICGGAAISLDREVFFDFTTAKITSFSCQAAHV